GHPLRAEDPGEDASGLPAPRSDAGERRGGGVMLSADHLAIRESVRDFVKAEVEPLASHPADEAAAIPAELSRQMAALAYSGLILSRDHGGSGLDTPSTPLVTEELSRAWLSVGSVMTRVPIAGTRIEASGTEEQKRRG